MASSFTQVPPDSTGDKLHMIERVRGSDTVLQQGVFIGEAPTYSAWANDVAAAASKHHTTIFNAAASGVVVQVHDVRFYNLGITAVTGVALRFDMLKASAASAGTTITPEKFDSGDANLPAGVTVRTNGTVTNGNRVMGFVTSGEEMAATLLARSHEGVSLLPNINGKQKPFTLREGEGLTVQQITSSTIGTFGWLVIFSAEPTYTAG